MKRGKFRDKKLKNKEENGKRLKKSVDRKMMLAWKLENRRINKDVNK